METKINIAEILKDKPEGTKLWTDMFGSVTLYVVTDACDAFQVKHHNKEPWFDKDGKLCKEGVLCIYPSESMRDWSKFTWKKGDVLVNKDNVHIIFEKFEDDAYTRFKGKHYLWKDCDEEDYNKEETKMLTSVFEKATDDVAQTYIKTIEEKLGGKLNGETLEVEKPQPEFKDGDIVTMHKENCDIVFIFNRLKTEGSFYYYAFHALQTNTGIIDCHTTLPCAWTFFEGKMNFATDSEKQQLFDALAKEGKAWDSDKKQIVDLPKKCEFKPMDWCLMRDVCEEKDETWSLCQFAYQFKSGQYEAVGGLRFDECIPYNEETAHLLGTTDDWEGGEA